MSHIERAVVAWLDRQIQANKNSEVRAILACLREDVISGDYLVTRGRCARVTVQAKEKAA